MVANNLAELEAILMNNLKMAMSTASSEMLNDMQKEMSAFYTQGNPKVYKRTHALENTPRVSPASINGNEISFEAYLDKSHNYTTGSFSMGDVLTNAEAHKAGILGKPHFWERSEKRMKKTFENTIRKYFK